ncbi:MAG: hypothetical protein V7724_09940 [Sediminicola sp.]
MKKILALLLLLGCMGCSKGISKEDLQHLNGYWEISLVEFPDGGEKEYTVSTTIDHIVLKESEGVRKKVRPTLEGTYIANSDPQSFRIGEKEGIFTMYYKNGQNEWTENLVALSESGFSVLGEQGITYHYKRYLPININD